MRSRTAAGLLRRFVLFNAICGVGIGLAVLLLHLFHSGLGWNRYLSNLLAIGLVTLWNFALNAHVNWRAERGAAKGLVAGGGYKCSVRSQRSLKRRRPLIGMLSSGVVWLPALSSPGGIEFEVQGLVVHVYHGADVAGQGRYTRTTAFGVYVRDCEWLIRLTNVQSELREIMLTAGQVPSGGAPVAYYQAGLVGTNAILVSVFEPPPGHPGASEAALAEISGIVVPRFPVAPELAVLWFAYCSHCYLDELGLKAGEPGRVQMEAVNALGRRQFYASGEEAPECLSRLGPVEVQRLSGAPGLPSHGRWLGEAGSLGVFTCHSTQNVGPAMLPNAWTYEQFASDSPGSPPVHTYSVGATVCQPKCSIAQLRLKVPEGLRETTVFDYRFASRQPRPVAKVVYRVSGPEWPTADEVRKTEAYTRALSMARSADDFGLGSGRPKQGGSWFAWPVAVLCTATVFVLVLRKMAARNKARD